MNELGIEQAVLVGNSLGGRIALELALRSPGRVAAMALLGLFIVARRLEAFDQRRSA